MTAARAGAATACGVALLAALPFAHGLLLGHSLYFRDLALHFMPLRLFALEGLRRGDLRYWNPFLHEGIPSPFPPVSYPIDLAQLLVPHEAGISLVLALHVPLAALTFLALARARGASRLGAAGGALAYALGGFCLSTLNLYVYVQAMAWAPLAVWALGRAATGGRRDVALAGLIVAVTLSTLGVEIVAQALLSGAVLAFRKQRDVLRRLAGTIALGAGLAAPSLLPLAAVVGGSQRARGFATEVVLAHSIHPLTWMQVVVAGWHGDPLDLANQWWGVNFFPRGFPYILSLYLGATVLSLAAAGTLGRMPGRGRVLVLAAAAALLCLGRYAGLAPLVDALPPLRAFRYPTKAFFTVHLAVALCAAHGLTLLEGGDRRAWRRLARVALATGALLVALSALPTVAPAFTSWFLSGFTPPEYTWTARDAVLRRVVSDAARGGFVALALGLLAVLVLKGRLPAPRAGLAAAGLVAADLLRAGAGLNPQVEPSFFRPSADLAQALPRLRTARVFTCPTHESPAYGQARRDRPGAHELWTFATQMETLTPETNVPLAVPTAYSEDFTSLLPPALVPREGEGCADFPRIEERLRRAGVAVVLSLDPLSASSLAPLGDWRPARIAPLSVYAYALRDPWPRRAVVAGGESARGIEAGQVLSWSDEGDRVEGVAEAAMPALLVVRDGYFPGWTAQVNGIPTPVLQVEEVHRGVPLAAGRSQVSLRYRPPGLRVGLVLCGVAALGMLVLCLLPSPRATPGGAPPARSS
jgi:membrane protein YfhO